MTKAEVIEKFTKIKGIGKAKAELLYTKGYDSINKLKSAKSEDLKKIEGITDPIIKNINNHLKEKTKAKTEEKVAKPKKTEKKAEDVKKPKKAEVKKPKEKKEEKLEPKKVKKEEEKETEEEEPAEEEEKYKVKKKPKLSKELKQQLIIRKQIKNRTPDFLREEWFRYKRIPRNWRRPDGITSKMRRNLKYRPSKVRIGFRGPKQTRGLHSSGFEEVIVNNVNDLKNLNPNTQAARIGSAVGTKKRIDIEKKAEELEVRILNI